jgi:hypothetical protein
MIRVVGTACVLMWSVFLTGQDPTTPETPATGGQVDAGATHPSGNGDCARCHTCPMPTAASPCLSPCPRTRPVATVESAARCPDLIVLDAFKDQPGIEDLYLPVPFDHKGHARMAEMSGGCSACHHYTPESGAQPACRTCHEIAPARENIRMPGLKGAYHRQCINCHRDWSHETACDICHMPRAGGRTPAGPLPSRGDILGKMHPPIPEPDTEFYQVQSGDAPGQRVIFRHKEHIHRFGISCANCHQGDSCNRCHGSGNHHEQRVVPLAEHHRPCASCHDVVAPQRCGRCHWEEGQPQPPPFDHASTGWALGRYHLDLTCRTCHRQVPFVSLDRACDGCHAAWNGERFDHAVVGLRLDETHRAFDCEDCHTERRFDAPPACAECHDEDEQIRYPDRKPGTATSDPSPKTATESG